jgi:hypothetical protein
MFSPEPTALQPWQGTLTLDYCVQSVEETKHSNLPCSLINDRSLIQFHLWSAALPRLDAACEHATMKPTLLPILVEMHPH